jgi:outer membrane protease
MGAMLVVVLLCDKARPDDGLVFGVGDDGQYSQAEELWRDWSDSGDRFWSAPPGPLALTIDYRVLTMFDSHTSYQFGTSPGYYRGNYAPLSKLDWSLNSVWTGFRIGAEEADSAGHFEWLTPMGQSINGGMYDYDWNINDNLPNDPTRLDSLSRSSGRWNEGQMLEIEYEFRLLKHPLGLPVDLWPLAGFRWQRFDITDYAGYQIIGDGEIVPLPGPFPPPLDGGDGITFKQEYSIGYLGAQLRGMLETWILPPIALTLQGDWGYTQANNVDHHLSYEYSGIHRYTMEDTHGDCLHVGLTAEALFCRDRFSIGLQADHTEINTTGSHRWVVSGNTTPVDETWTNGVSVSSRQTAITAFLRLRF